jgi:MFS family permease
VFAFVWLGYQSVDLSLYLYENNVHFYQPSEYGLLTRFTTWDSSHYLVLARDGYHERLHQTNAFAPVLPHLTRAAGQITGDLVVAGLIVSNVASAAALWLLWSLVRRRWGEAVAWRTLVLLLAFPTAFFLSMVYTESLFLLLAVATFWGMEQATGGGQRATRWGLAVATVAAFLMPLTRWIGVVIAAPIGVWALLRAMNRDLPRQAQGEQTRGWAVGPGTRGRLRWDASILLVLAPLAGAAVYLALMRLETGDWLSQVHAARLYPARWEITTLLQPWQLWETTFGRGLTVHGQMTSVADRLLFAGFVASAPLVYRRVSLPMFGFYLLMGLTPLMGSYMSYARYLLPAFPLFIAWGGHFQEHPLWMPGIVMVMVVLQAMFVMAHTSSHWVA